MDEKFNNFEELNNIPSNFEFSKTISTDLFKKNFYNNRACIFVSCEDNNVYIAFGESSLNLEGYNVIEDEKFTIKVYMKIFLILVDIIMIKKMKEI